MTGLVIADPLHFMTPEEHLERARQLACDAERALLTDGETGDVAELSMLSRTHVALAAEIDRQRGKTADRQGAGGR